MATLEPIAVTMTEAARLGGCTRVLVDDLKTWVREQER